MRLKLCFCLVFFYTKLWGTGFNSGILDIYEYIVVKLAEISTLITIFYTVKFWSLKNLANKYIFAPIFFQFVTIICFSLN